MSWRLPAATICIPLLAVRMLKVDAIALTRFLALPFVLGIGLLPLAVDEGGLLLILVGGSYAGRISMIDALIHSILELWLVPS